MSESIQPNLISTIPNENLSRSCFVELVDYN